nr:hypothetical protein Iba_chr05dCG7930 [Ipomoea batatas]
MREGERPRPQATKGRAQEQRNNERPVRIRKGWMDVGAIRQARWGEEGKQEEERRAGAKGTAHPKQRGGQASQPTMANKEGHRLSTKRKDGAQWKEARGQYAEADRLSGCQRREPISSPHWRSRCQAESQREVAANTADRVEAREARASLARGRRGTKRATAEQQRGNSHARRERSAACKSRAPDVRRRE